MWKWTAIASLLALVVQAGYPMRPVAVAKDQFPDSSGPQRLADAAMQRVKEQDFHGAVAIVAELARPANKKLPPDVVAAQIDSGTREILKQRDSIKEYGPPLNEVEFVGREVIGKSYVVFSYLEKFEYRAIVWRVTFYRTKDEWISAGFEWRTDLQPFVRADSSDLNDAR